MSLKIKTLTQNILKAVSPVVFRAIHLNIRIYHQICVIISYLDKKQVKEEYHKEKAHLEEKKLYHLI